MHHATLITQKPCCYGCGVGLQVTDAETAGYVSPEKLAIKAQHKKQLQTVRCIVVYACHCVAPPYIITALVCAMPSAQQWCHDPRG